MSLRPLHPHAKATGDNNSTELASIILFIGISGLLVLTSASQAEEAADAVRIAGTVYLVDIPTSVADRFATFEANGVSAVVEYSASGQRSPERLMSGEVDFALWQFPRFYGIESTAVEKSCIAFDDTPHALLTGRVHAAVLPDPRTFRANTESAAARPRRSWSQFKRSWRRRTGPLPSSP